MHAVETILDRHVWSWHEYTLSACIKPNMHTFGKDVLSDRWQIFKRIRWRVSKRRIDSLWEEEDLPQFFLRNPAHKQQTILLKGTMCKPQIQNELQLSTDGYSVRFVLHVIRQWLTIRSSKAFSAGLNNQNHWSIFTPYIFVLVPWECIKLFPKVYLLSLFCSFPLGLPAPSSVCAR